MKKYYIEYPPGEAMAFDLHHSLQLINTERKNVFSSPVLNFSDSIRADRIATYNINDELVWIKHKEHDINLVKNRSAIEMSRAKLLTDDEIVELTIKILNQ